MSLNLYAVDIVKKYINCIGESKVLTQVKETLKLRIHGNYSTAFY